MPYLGEIAALTTALCWTFTSLFFTEASKRIGSFRVNNIRLVLAVIIYSIVLLATTGNIWPENMNWMQFFWLALSALIGLVIGDGFGFEAFVLIGPRLTTLLWAAAPIGVTIIAWVFLGEQLHVVDIVGIAVTVGGISWVVAERRFKANGRPQPDLSDAKKVRKGILYGTIAALGQGTGLVLSKQGMLYSGEPIGALPASFVRMFSAMIMIWLLTWARGRLPSTIKAVKDSRAMVLSLGGAVFGPFFGVWMSLVAVKLIAAGIAATLNAMTPVLIIPVVMAVYKEKVSLRAMLGAILAVIGVAILFMGNELSQLF